MITNSPTEAAGGPVKIAALAKIEGVQSSLDREADALTKKWQTEYRVVVNVLRLSS